MDIVSRHLPTYTYKKKLASLFVNKKYSRPLSHIFHTCKQNLNIDPECI